MKRNQLTKKWYDQRSWASILAITAFSIAYLVGSRSLDTGSRWQYLITIVLLVFFLNRLWVIARSFYK